MDFCELIAERKIREAMAEGAFDHLQGAGQPIALDEDPFEDPSVRLAHRLLKNNGFAPAWIEESKSIDAAVAQWRLDVKRGSISPAELRHRAAELNRRISAYNVTTPAPSSQKFVIDADAEMDC